MTVPSVLITGASSGIGATYADRFAKRGHDLVLVARSRSRLDALASRLREEHGVGVNVLPADLTSEAEAETVAQCLRDDHRIGVLINNAGAVLAGGFDTQQPGDIARMINLNSTTPALLARAAVERFATQNSGSIVNVASVVGLAPEFGQTIYGATKAFLIFMSQGLAREFGSKGVYVQAVLPAATRTEIWSHTGLPAHAMPPMMEVENLVDAALVGFDRKEAVTIPPLQDHALWDEAERARGALLPQFSNILPGSRYKQ